jgi:hypothetical protein
MSWAVNWDGAFVVGGDGSQRLTPNFRLKEFQRPNGSVRIHRELVTNVQVLRDRLGKPLSIAGVDDDGLGATISGVAAPDVTRASESRPTRLFASVEDSAGKVHVRIPDPANALEIELAEALETAFLVTSAFETAGDKFQQITGNFDGAGFSFGPAQMNFKSGPLVPLFRRFQKTDEASLRAAFTDSDDYATWLKVLDMPSSADQVKWANDHSTGPRNSLVVEPWRTYFQNVGKVGKFREIMVDEILRQYGEKLLNAVNYLQSLKPGMVIDHLRCVCSLWDLVIQQGSLDKAKAAIEARVRKEQPADQFHLVRIGVEERAKTSTGFADDCGSRRLGVLNGVPQTVGNVQRANVMFYLLRDARVKSAAQIASMDVNAELAKASSAVAMGVSV